MAHERPPDCLPLRTQKARPRQGPGPAAADLEANRLGCEVLGWAITPMAYWIVRQELLTLDLAAYEQAAQALRGALTARLGALYQTTCGGCGEAVWAKYFIWVKTLPCTGC